MKKTVKYLAVFVGLVCIALVLIALLTSCTPMSVAFLNSWEHAVQKVDDATSYRTRKQVEDTCRATIVSYESDKLTYEQYKDSEDAEQRGWADAAKLRANKAAITYNEYFLKNSYVFEGNIPADIRAELPLVE